MCDSEGWVHGDLMSSLVTCCCDTLPDLNVRDEMFLLARGFKRDSPSQKAW